MTLSASEVGQACQLESQIERVQGLRIATYAVTREYVRGNQVLGWAQSIP